MQELKNAITLISLTQRIYSISYTERTATPFVFYNDPLFHRKPETERKTTLALLSAVLRNIFFFGGGGLYTVLY